MNCRTVPKRSKSPASATMPHGNPEAMPWKACRARMNEAAPPWSACAVKCAVVAYVQVPIGESTVAHGVNSHVCAGSASWPSCRQLVIKHALAYVIGLRGTTQHFRSGMSPPRSCVDTRECGRLLACCPTERGRMSRPPREPDCTSQARPS
jgi:hypothetical protein